MAIGTTAALLLGGAAVGSAALSSSASRSAGSTVAGATDRAADLQNQQFQQFLALQMPGYRRGEQASSAYMQALGLGGPSQAQTAPGGYSSQPGGTQAGGYQGGYSGGIGGGGAAMLMAEQGDTSIQPMQRLMTGGQMPQSMTGQGGPQTLPPAQGNPAQGGQGGQGGSLDIYEQVRNTPGYQSQLDQGIKSIDRAAPLTGGMYSGRRMKALNDYGQNTFGSYYNDWMNRVGGVAGQGAQTAQNVGQAGMQNANNVGNLMMTGANARAQGQQNSASAWTGAIGTGIGLYGGSQGWFGR